MMERKRLVLFLMSFVVIFVLVACGGDASSTQTGDSVEEPNEVSVSPTETVGVEESDVPSEVVEEEVGEETVSEVVDVPLFEGEAFEVNFPFDPEANGFQFRNYTTRYPEGNMTIAEARSMFGDVVCTRVKDDGDCVPHPKVLTWVDNMNATMDEVGRCVGFTVASHQLLTAYRSVNDLGAEFAYELPTEIPVLRTIGEAYSSYYASNVWPQEVQGKTPTEIVEALLKLDEPVDIGIFAPQYGRNGHSILGYDVVNQGEGIFHIMVYDSNDPGKENFIVVDTVEDTWYYAEGAMNPDQPRGKYIGDAETKSLSFIPLSAYSQSLACPSDFVELCPNPDAERFSVVTFLGKGGALVKALGGQIGKIGEDLVNTITNARLLGVRGELYSRQQPLMLIPEEGALTVELSGADTNDPITLSIANPSFTVVVDQVVGQVGQVEQVALDPAVRTFNFTAGGSQRPVFQFTFTQGETVYFAVMDGLWLEAGQRLDVVADPATGQLTFASADLVDATSVLAIVRLSPQGETIFANQAFAVLPNGVTLDLPRWDGAGAMPLQSGEPLTNQPLTEVLGAMPARNAAFNVLPNLVPYLNDVQTEEVQTAVPQLGLLSMDLGTFYLQQPKAQPDALAPVLAALEYSPFGLANFAAALRLPQEAADQLINELELPEEDRQTFQDSLQSRYRVFDAVDEWDFLNTDEPAALLPSFVEEQELVESERWRFLTQIDLPNDAMGATVSTVMSATDLCADIPLPENGLSRIHIPNYTNQFIWTAPLDLNGNIVRDLMFTARPGTYIWYALGPGTPIAVMDANQNIIDVFTLSDQATGCFDVTSTVPTVSLSSSISQALPQPDPGPVNPNDCSIDSSFENFIEFVNTTGSPVDVYWVNFDCVEQLRFTIGPGEFVEHQTFPTHPWRVRDAATGQLLVLTTPNGKSPTITHNGDGVIRVFIGY